MSSSERLPEEVVDLVREAIDCLDPVETEVINALFYERIGRKRLGDRLNMSPRQVARVRDRGIRKLGHLLGVKQDLGEDVA